MAPQRASHAQIIASRQVLQNPHLDQLPVTGQASDRQEYKTPPGGGYQHPPALRAHPHCVSDGGLRPRHKVAPNFPFGSCEVAVSASLPWASPIPNFASYACKLHNKQKIIYNAIDVNYSITFTHVNTQKRITDCLLYTSPSPRDGLLSRMPSSA